MTLTVKAIEAAIEKDGGNAYRALLKKWLPKIEDAYRQEEPDSFRKHYGFSKAGEKCNRNLWYGFRWFALPEFPARILRLFNRGHREEATFLAMLEMIGVTLYDPDDGGQWRVSAYGGHAGSALDAVLWGVPDLPNEYCLGEFKTMNDKSFKALKKAGLVKLGEQKHYTQMQLCMLAKGIHYTLYMVVNKNDDSIYSEIVPFDWHYADKEIKRIGANIFAENPPEKIGQPGFYLCKWCDFQDICHYDGKPLRNCRSCAHSTPLESGGWYCQKNEYELSHEAQLAGCENYKNVA